MSYPRLFSNIHSLILVNQFVFRSQSLKPLTKPLKTNTTDTKAGLYTMF